MEEAPIVLAPGTILVSTHDRLARLEWPKLVPIAAPFIPAMANPIRVADPAQGWIVPNLRLPLLGPELRLEFRGAIPFGRLAPCSSIRGRRGGNRFDVGGSIEIDLEGVQPQGAQVNEVRISGYPGIQDNSGYVCIACEVNGAQVGREDVGAHGAAEWSFPVRPALTTGAPGKIKVSWPVGRNVYYLDWIELR